MNVTPGILLQSIPYLGEKKILKVFTRDHGLLSFFTKKTNLTPFCIAEWIYRDTNKELLSLKEANLIDPFLHLKENYEVLNAAGSIARDLLFTQMPNQKSEPLFLLSTLYLKKLNGSSESLVSSFKLKLLIHEGLFPEISPAQFSPREWEQLKTLAFSRSIDTILKTSAPHEKITSFFSCASKL